MDEVEPGVDALAGLHEVVTAGELDQTCTANGRDGLPGHLDRHDRIVDAVPRQRRHVDGLEHRRDVDFIGHGDDIA